MFVWITFDTNSNKCKTELQSSNYVESYKGMVIHIYNYDVFGNFFSIKHSKHFSWWYVVIPELKGEKKIK